MMSIGFIFLFAVEVFLNGVAVLLRLFWIGKRKISGSFASLTMPAEAHLLTP
jgi:hypothetical protein